MKREKRVPIAVSIYFDAHGFPMYESSIGNPCSEPNTHQVYVLPSPSGEIARLEKKKKRCPHCRKMI